MQDLPKTYRDTVFITRQLDFQYLWIDSLYIIQDSGEDWKRESENIGDIYRNLTCYIIVLATIDSTAGCFFPRNPTVHFPYKLGTSGHDNITIAVQPDSRQYDYTNGSFNTIRNPFWTRV